MVALEFESIPKVTKPCPHNLDVIWSVFVITDVCIGIQFSEWLGMEFPEGKLLNLSHPYKTPTNRMHPEA